MTTKTVATLTQDERAAAQSVVSYWISEQVGRFSDPEQVTLVNVGDFVERLERFIYVGPVGDPGAFGDPGMLGGMRMEDTGADELRELAAEIEDHASGYAADLEPIPEGQERGLRGGPF
jgi:hypothetical protein